MIRAVSSPVASQFGPGAWHTSVITPIAAVPPEPHRPLYEHRRLLAAVLQQAIDDATEATEDGERARDWFASDDVHDPFAFAAICDVLDLDAGRIRTLIASRVPTRLHQSSLLLDVPPREYLPASGCAVCGWQGVERVCTDPDEHNPCCVRRNPAAAHPKGTRAPKPRRLPCARCGGTQDVGRAMLYVGGGQRRYHRLCYSCRVEFRKTQPPTKHTERGIERMSAILGSLRNRGGRAALADLQADLPGWNVGTLQWRLHRMSREGKIRIVRRGLYEVLP